METMDEEFPLLLPDGTAAVSLPGHDDHCWIVEASTCNSDAATWTFGIQPGNFGRHLCLHRFKLWWLKPSHGHSGLDIPPETALFLAEMQPQQQQQQQQYVALLPVSDTHARASLHRAGDDSSNGEGLSPSGAAVDEDSPSALAVSADTGDPATLLPDTLGVLLVATGPDPFRLVQRLVREATDRLSTQLVSLKEGARSATVAERVDPGACGEDRGSCDDEGKGRPVASFVDSLGWCTWDSFYTMVTPEGVLEGLSTLHEGGVRPRWVVIDDGWQRTTNDDALNTEQWDERLVGLEANKRFRRFDEKGKLLLDLGDTVGKMKRDFGVERVLAWHAMAGYWAGVEPEASEMVPFDPLVAKLLAPEGIQEVDPEMQPELDHKRFGMVRLGNVEAFYRAYHGYLRDNGVDGVKVDAQSILDCMGGGNGGVPAVTKAYHEGLVQSVQATFKEGGRPAALIHCMCHAPSVLFHIACVSEDRAVIRGSDDFYPREDLSHGPHLYSNSFNALLLSNLGVQDWDMFQTGLGVQGTGDAAGAAGLSEGANASWFHAAARAISGGPVYVSDRPGQHNADILRKLVLEDGSVPRASTNALPTLDCLMRDPQEEGGGLLQVWALNPLAGTGVVGSFNVRGASFSQSERAWVRAGRDDEARGGGAVEGTVSPSDVHAFRITKPHADRAGGAGEMPPAPGDGVEENEDETRCCFALYLHRRRETRVVSLLEAVAIEVLPLSYELATFSRVIGLRLPPLGISTSGEQQQGSSAADVVESRDGDRPGYDAQEDTVRWAILGLSDMFNSSAAVSAQEPFQRGATTRSSGVECDGGMVPGVAVYVKGSGKFLAVASRQPSRVTLGGVGGDGAVGSAGLEQGVIHREDGRDDSGRAGGSGDVTVLDASFSALCAATPDGPPSTALSVGGGRAGLGLVEVVIPGPWDGRERQLTFWWH
ncbi:Alpha-galactosidase, family GH36 [Ectocarpus siliculosus]|uniref:galactinol--sucrose galactosyltransferase n=1 Tax=Ectocarpus siliculosus TaxID=2880 RepID=D8LQ35_ECTSI|nr:Alpha-galactosidase, family GH36 [Ectocarpus siliculosus]|eukprot:CBN77415.1 Alpha-galactosidase, family GH36 [Ectocarpus siliculosus]